MNLIVRLLEKVIVKLVKWYISILSNLENKLQDQE